MFVNSMDVDSLRDAYGSNANNIGRAVRLLAAVRDHADENSDGWAYWRKPSHACNQLVELLRRCNVMPHAHWLAPAQPTDAELRKAVAPIKTFYTKTRASITSFPAFPAHTLE